MPSKNYQIERAHQVINGLPNSSRGLEIEIDTVETHGWPAIYEFISGLWDSDIIYLRPLQGFRFWVMEKHYLDPGGNWQSVAGTRDIARIKLSELMKKLTEKRLAPEHKFNESLL